MHCSIKSHLTEFTDSQANCWCTVHIRGRLEPGQISAQSLKTHSRTSFTLTLTPRSNLESPIDLSNQLKPAYLCPHKHRGDMQTHYIKDLGPNEIQTALFAKLFCMNFIAHYSICMSAYVTCKLFSALSLNLFHKLISSLG